MGWLDNMILRSRLILLGVVMVIGMAILSYSGFSGAVEWVEDVDKIEENGIRQGAVLKMDRERMIIRTQTLRVYEFQDDFNAQSEFLKVLDERKKSFENFDKSMKEFEALIKSPELKKLFADFTQKYEAWRTAYVSIDAIIKKLADNKDATVQRQLFEEYKLAVKAMIPASEAMGASLTALLKWGEEEINKTQEEAYRDATTFKTLVMTVPAVVVMLVTLLVILIVRSVTTSITNAVTTVSEGALQTSLASNQISSSSASLAQSVSEQTSSVEEINATLEEAIAGITSNTESARQADILAKSASAAAKDGLAKGEELVESMKEVTESAAKIANIAKTIDQIAFQVNLLALNAAVEAARAGEHGLGFAVVADEVRNLAQRAANSAKETGVVIEEVLAQIKKGSEMAGAANASFKDIDDKAKKVSDLIGEVALSSKEQAEGLNQLGTAMSQIEQVTQQVAANSEETAAAAEELNAQAVAALEAVAQLAKIVGIDINQNISRTKTSTRAPRTELKKEVRHIASKPSSKQTLRAQKRDSDEIFPLDESDLKEF